jgi:signal transduction histidine kinase
MNLSVLRQYRRLLSIGISLSALLILNGTSWWIYQVGTHQIRSNFVRNLEATAGLFVHQIRLAYREDLERGIELIDSKSWSVPSTRSPSQGEGNVGSATATLDDESLASLAELVPDFHTWFSAHGTLLLPQIIPAGFTNETFHDVYLLNRQAALMTTLSGDFIPNATLTKDISWHLHPFLIEDRAEILQSLRAAIPVTTRENLQDGIYYLTTYSPIQDLEGETCGLVGIRAPLLFGDRLHLIKRRLLIADLIGSLLVILLAVMFNRLSGGLERVENRLRDQERLAQLGQMVAVVAHEIRNPLGIIEQTAEMIRRRYDREGRDEILKYIPEEVERLNRLVSRFLLFARPTQDPVSPGTEQSEKPMCRLIDEIQKIYEQLFNQAQAKGILFKSALPADLVAIELDPDAVRQILLNLILNAIEATPAGKEVVVLLEIQPGKGKTGILCLKVSDQGVGMNAETLAHARDPFFTTKEKGSGLGLALVTKLVAETGGTFSIQSEPGVGTTVQVTWRTPSS